MTRQSTHSIGGYKDCFEILERAVANEGLALTFDTPAQATRFRHRCYSARKTLFKMQGETPYDGCEIRRDPANLSKILFTFRSAADLPARIERLDGTAPLAEADEFEIDAMNLRKELGL